MPGLDELVCGKPPYTEPANAETLFDRLLVQPLNANFSKPDTPVIIIIEGLDEATVDGHNELCRFLGKHCAMWGTSISNSVIILSFENCYP